MRRHLHVLRTRASWPFAALLGGSLLAACLALAPSRAEAITASSYCSPAGIIFCYKPEVVWGPGGPTLAFYFNPATLHGVWEF